MNDQEQPAEGTATSAPCKRDGCSETVVYQPGLVWGALKRSRSKPARERTVYLRCPAGHTHAYRVMG